MFGTATPIRTACWGLAEFTNAFLRPEPALYPPRGITRFGRRRLSKSDFALLTAKIPETDPDCLGASGLTGVGVGQSASPALHWIRIAGWKLALGPLTSWLMWSPYFLGASLAAAHLRASTRRPRRRPRPRGLAQRQPHSSVSRWRADLFSRQ